MQRLRLRILAMLGWFFALYNIERLHEPINIASFVYIYTAIAGFCIISFRIVQSLSLRRLLILPLPLFFLLKIWLGYPIGGTNLPITVTEICTIEISVLLAKLITRSLRDVEEAVTSATLSHLKIRSYPFEVAQAEIYREIRRARLYGRPLTLMAISATGDVASAALPQFMKEIQQETIHKYTEGRIADFLSDELKDCDIIAQRNSKFVALLPETSRAGAARLVDKLMTAAKEKLGVSLTIGFSTFPDQEVTFDMLLKSAEVNMQSRNDQVSGDRELALTGSPPTRKSEASGIGGR